MLHSTILGIVILKHYNVFNMLKKDVMVQGLLPLYWMVRVPQYLQLLTRKKTD
jgi:hypothetical protein